MQHIQDSPYVLIMKLKVHVGSDACMLEEIA